MLLAVLPLKMLLFESVSTDGRPFVRGSVFTCWHGD